MNPNSDANQLPHVEQVNKVFNDSMAHLVPSLCGALGGHFDRIPVDDDWGQYHSQLLEARAAGENLKVDETTLDSLSNVVAYLSDKGAHLNGEVAQVDYLRVEYQALMRHYSI